MPVSRRRFYSCLIGAGLFLGKKVASREDVLDSGKPPKLIILSVTTGLVSLVHLSAASYIHLRRLDSVHSLANARRYFGSGRA